MVNVVCLILRYKQEKFSKFRNITEKNEFHFESNAFSSFFFFLNPCLYISTLLNIKSWPQATF